MPAEKGIFLDVLPRFDMAAMGAILGRVEGMFAKSGQAIGATMGKAANDALLRSAEEARKAANIKEEASLRASRAVHAEEVAQLRLNEVMEAGTASASAYTKAQGDLEVAKIRYNKVMADTTASEERQMRALTTLIVSEQRLAEVQAESTASASAQARAVYALSDAKLAATARTRDLTRAEELSNAATDAFMAKQAAAGVTGSNAMRAFGIAGVASLGGFAFAAAESTKKAADFQQAMIKLTASAGEQSSNIQTVSDGILKLSGQVGISANQLADSMFLVEKAGYRGGDGVKVLTAASQLANAEGADLDDTIKGLTTTMRDFGFGVDQAATVASKMNVAAGDSKAPLQEFSSALHNVEPTAAMAKIKIDEVYAAMSRITQSGAGADQASDWLNNTIGHLMNMNDQQKTFLSQIGLDPVQLQADLGNAKIGMNGVITEISDKIKSQLNPNQQLVLNTQYQSVNALQSMNKIYDTLSPKAKALADTLKAGTLDKDDQMQLRLAERNEPNLRAWEGLFQKLGGVNQQLKKGQGDLIGVAAAFAKAFGTDSGLKVVSLLAGTPEQAEAMRKEIERIQQTTQEADGTVKGFNETQEGLNKKLADAKAGFGAAAVQLGNDFIPAMTATANVMKDVAGYLNQHKILLDVLVTGLGLAGGAWTAMKLKMMGTELWNFLSSMQAKAVVDQNAVTAAAERTNAALAAAGPAAAKGEAGVATAAAAEVASEERVAASALEADGALAGGAAGAGAAGTGLGLGALFGGGMAAPLAVGVAGGYAISTQTTPITDPIINSGNGTRGDLANAIQRHKNGINPGYAGLPLAAPGQDRGAANPERRIGLPGGGAAANQDPLAALNTLVPPADGDGTIPAPVWNPDGASGGGSGASAGAPPVGTQNDPIYIDPSAITDGLNDSDMGAQGQVGSGIMDIFAQAGSGGFTLPNIARLMTTFVANLALGNPAGKLATGVGLGGGDGDGDSLAASATQIENMSPTERIEQENTIRLQKSIRAYKKALRAYAKAVAKYGPNSDQALDAEDSALSAKDSISQVMINQQQAGGSAAQAYADDLARGTGAKNPGKVARDQAAAAAYGGGSGGFAPAGAGAEAWRSTVADTVAKYGPAMNIPPSQYGNWTDAIVSQIQTESGGNPQASNPHDSNGRGGTQDVEGLLQYLPSSYQNSGGKLTGLPYMDPVGQIAGALFASRNSQGGPSGIGHGIGWGPTSQSINGAALAADDSSIPAWLQDSVSGPGEGGPRGPSLGPLSPAGGGTAHGPGYSDFIGPGTNTVGNGTAVNRESAGGAKPGLFGPAVGGAPAAKPVTNGVGSGMKAAMSMGAPASPGVKSSQPASGSGKGAGVSGGALGMAEGAAAMAANALAPGAGAAVQVATQEANRFAGYLGQVGGILASGALETFTLHGGDGSSKGGWLSKIAGGLAGAHASIDNSAGGMDSKKDPTGAAAPLTPDSTNGQQQGKGGTTDNSNNINIQNQNINHDDGGANNRDALRQLQAFPGFTG